MTPASLREHASVLASGATTEAQSPLPSEPIPAAGEHAKHRAMQEIQNASFAEEGRILRLALAWHATGDADLLKAAKLRALHLAGWSPAGATSFRHHDQSARAVGWALTLAYDWLHDAFTPEERARLLSAIRPRVADMLAPSSLDNPYGLDMGRKFDRRAHDSHGEVTLARLAVMCTALAGEDPLFDVCVEEVVPRYLARPLSWGGEEGGFANGTAYAQWDVLYTHFVVWHLLQNALGVDLGQQAWAQGYGRFIAYFLPPGAPTGLFGDGAEKVFRNVWATQARAYAAHLPSPLADWYARNQFGEDPLHLALLLALPRDWNAVPGALPAGTPHAVHLADIGWVAMHSDLGDRARTSVYFKSSPYGSYNHSHADQNGFVIHARGRALAIDSGYYDYYSSPHWKDWYKQTRAHNAITFDGGQGQMHDTMAAKGRITQFQNGAQADLASGDATEAYGRTLKRAVRSLVYVRPDMLLVFDDLASDIPRTWEWNLHALSRMKEYAGQALEIEQDAVRLCVRMLAAPEGAFTQTDRFSAGPQGEYPTQWHARYATRHKTAEAQFVALVEVGCGGTEVASRREAGRQVVLLAGRRFEFDGNGVAVLR
ncbi:MAG: heparinase II/III family protein [Betaproteobacteria bacterium]|nr:heparinase II/III family protein [Betaproteobacteria bacterium]